MKPKRKVRCTHAHICIKIASPIRCQHENDHSYHFDCNITKCEFLSNELHKKIIVTCNMSQIRKEKLEKLNEYGKNESDI